MPFIRYKQTGRTVKVGREEAKEVVATGEASFVDAMPSKLPKGYQTRQVRSSQIKTK